MRWSLLVFAVACAAIPIAAAECGRPPDAEVQMLLSAQNVEELDRAAATSGGHLAVRALYRTRRYAFVATDAEARRYFKALPRTDRELWCVYTLTWPGDWAGQQEAGDAVYGMFERAARIARRLGTGHDRVLRLALWSDGELGYPAWDAFHWLLMNDPELTVAAIRRLPASEQKRVCDGSVVDDGLVVREVVKRCRARI